jgi:hypothetical protein
MGWLERIFRRAPSGGMSADEIAEDSASRNFKADYDVTGSAVDRANDGRVSPCPTCPVLGQWI